MKKFFQLAGTCALLAATMSASAQEVDPFDLPKDSSPAEEGGTPVSVSLDLVQQSSYIPNLLGAGGDLLDNHSIADAIFKWDVTDTMKIKARGIYSYTDRSVGDSGSHDGELLALELFYEQRFLGQTQALSVGRKNLGWSSGFQWRPADLIENGFSTKNTDTVDPARYRGIDQVQYELNEPGFNLVGVLSNQDRSFYQGRQFAAKLSVNRLSELSLLYAIVGSYSRKYGLALDASLPLGTTLALEAVHVDVDEDKLTDPFYFGRTLESLSGTHSYEDVYVGLTKFIDDKRRISLEYFHNGRGLKDALPASGSSLAQAPAIDPAIFEKEYLGRQYLHASYTGYVDAWKLQIKPSVLMNTGDGSFIGAISFNREIGGNSELTLKLNSFNGGRRSDFGAISRGVGLDLSYILHLF